MVADSFPPNEVAKLPLTGGTLTGNLVFDMPTGADMLFNIADGGTAGRQYLRIGELAGGTNIVILGGDDSSPDQIYIIANGTTSARFYPGQIRVVDGTAGTPAYSFINDPDTGIYRDSSGARYTKDGVDQGVIGGGIALLGRTVLTATLGLAFTSIPATYDHLLLIWEAQHTTSNPNMHLNINNDGSAGMYEYSITHNSGSAVSVTSSAGDVKVLIGQVATNGGGGMGRILIPNYAGSRPKKILFESMGITSNSTAPLLYHGAGVCDSTSAVTRVDLTASSGVMDGLFSLYGLRSVV